MPGYVTKKLLEYKHPKLRQRQDCPLMPAPRSFGKHSQRPTEPNDSPIFHADEKKYIERAVGSFLFYERAVDPTTIHVLSDISSTQAKLTASTKKKTTQFLDYIDTHPDAKIRYYASDMVLSVHSDASYLCASNTRSRAAGHFFLGSILIDMKTIKLNGVIHTLCQILKLVAAGWSFYGLRQSR